MSAEGPTPPVPGPATGTLTDNPYFRSVGLDQDALLGRARQLPGLRIRSELPLIEIDWTFPDMAAWAAEVLS